MGPKGGLVALAQLLPGEERSRARCHTQNGRQSQPAVGDVPLRYPTMHCTFTSLSEWPPSPSASHNALPLSSSRASPIPQCAAPPLSHKTPPRPPHNALLPAPFFPRERQCLSL
ncbi:protein BTG4 [Platysternon megacephalum]|uniref:Protein BTG4 n=1 Tax=Platysternon megacephalum TaxID=55544 RepID=A0A4D9DTH4_9SAUR|nr:protein BTG4 [Platysternon megacephalum]